MNTSGVGVSIVTSPSNTPLVMVTVFGMIFPTDEVKVSVVFKSYIRL